MTGSENKWHRLAGISNSVIKGLKQTRGPRRPRSPLPARPSPADSASQGPADAETEPRCCRSLPQPPNASRGRLSGARTPRSPESGSKSAPRPPPGPAGCWHTRAPAHGRHTYAHARVHESTHLHTARGCMRAHHRLRLTARYNHACTHTHTYPQRHTLDKSTQNTCSAHTILAKAHSTNTHRGTHSIHKSTHAHIVSIHKDRRAHTRPHRSAHARHELDMQLCVHDATLTEAHTMQYIAYTQYSQRHTPPEWRHTQHSQKHTHTQSSPTQKCVYTHTHRSAHACHRLDAHRCAYMDAHNRGMGTKNATHITQQSTQVCVLSLHDLAQSHTLYRRFSSQPKQKKPRRTGKEEEQEMVGWAETPVWSSLRQ